jgi:formate dehydrogenase subunit gamma
MSEISPTLEGSLLARHREDVFVEGRIVRHRLSSRLIHWSVALTFVLALITGMPIWTPIFGWMASLVGGLHVCRWLHPWTGVGFAVASLVMFVHWMGVMAMDKSEREWLSPRKMIEYLSRREDQNVGKYNGGQKVFFWFAALGALLLLLSGFVMWFPESMPQLLREFSYLLHDASFIAFAVAIVGHIYLGTAAGPGTFGAMTHGTVTASWARLHHPRWYREVATSDPNRRT